MNDVQSFVKQLSEKEWSGFDELKCYVDAAYRSLEMPSDHSTYGVWQVTEKIRSTDVWVRNYGTYVGYIQDIALHFKYPPSDTNRNTYMHFYKLPSTMVIPPLNTSSSLHQQSVGRTIGVFVGGDFWSGRWSQKELEANLKKDMPHCWVSAEVYGNGDHVTIRGIGQQGHL